MENTPFGDTFKGLKVLVMSYSNMKPMEPRYHDFLADWVRKGGALIYCGEDIDPYQSVLEWWNSNGNQYKGSFGTFVRETGTGQSTCCRNLPLWKRYGDRYT